MRAAAHSAAHTREGRVDKERRAAVGADTKPARRKSAAQRATRRQEARAERPANPAQDRMDWAARGQAASGRNLTNLGAGRSAQDRSTTSVLSDQVATLPSYDLFRPQDHSPRPILQPAPKGTVRLTEAPETVRLTEVPGTVRLTHGNQRDYPRKPGQRNRPHPSACPHPAPQKSSLPPGKPIPAENLSRSKQPRERFATETIPTAQFS